MPAAPVRSTPPFEPTKGSNPVGCIAALVCVAVLGAGLFVAVKDSFERSLRGGVDVPDFDAEAPDVVRARKAANAATSDALDEVAATATTIHPIGPRGWTDRCERGEANWKYHDDEAVVCTTTSTQVFAFGGPDASNALRSIVTELAGDSCGTYETSDAADGVAPQTQTWGYVWSDYEMNSLRDGGRVRCVDASPAPVEVVQWMSLAPTMPTEDRASLQLALHLDCELVTGHCTETALELDDVLDAAGPEDRWAVILVSSVEYLTVGWD